MTPEPASPSASTSATIPRRTVVSFAIGAVVLLGIVGTVLVRAKWPALTPEEAKHCGTWYGYINEGRRHYCWLAELRRDRTCRISFRDFEATYVTPMGVTARTAVSGQVNVSVGTWRMDASGYYTTTWYPRDAPGVGTRLFALLLEQRWLPHNATTHAYRVDQLSDTDFAYTHRGEGVTYHAVRVRDDFVLPEEPVLPCDAVAWWRARTEARRE